VARGYHRSPVAVRAAASARASEAATRFTLDRDEVEFVTLNVDRGHWSLTFDLFDEAAARGPKERERREGPQD